MSGSRRLRPRFLTEVEHSRLAATGGGHECPEHALWPTLCHPRAECLGHYAVRSCLFFRSGVAGLWSWTAAVGRFGVPVSGTYRRDPEFRAWKRTSPTLALHSGCDRKGRVLFQICGSILLRIPPSCRSCFCCGVPSILLMAKLPYLEEAIFAFHPAFRLRQVLQQARHCAIRLSCHD